MLLCAPCYEVYQCWALEVPGARRGLPQSRRVLTVACMTRVVVCWSRWQGIVNILLMWYKLWDSGALGLSATYFLDIFLLREI